jgi:hypothetical protein
MYGKGLKALNKKHPCFPLASQNLLSYGDYIPDWLATHI